MDSEGQSHKPPITDTIFRLSSAIVLLVGPIYFGEMGKPKEMAIIIVAGFIGLVFSNLDKFESFKAGGLEAKLKEQIEAIVDKETEPEYASTSDFINSIDEDTQKIVTALNNPEFTWRTISGLVQDTKKSKNDITQSLKWLLDNKYVRKSHNAKGNIWSLTPDGRTLAVKIRFKGFTGGTPKPINN